jgi:hypothetical protein
MPLLYRYHIFFIHSLGGGHQGWFHRLTIVNSVTINMSVQVFPLRCVWFILTDIQEWCICVIWPSTLIFLRNLHIDFCSGLTTFPTARKGSFSHNPHKHLSFL